MSYLIVRTQKRCKGTLHDMTVLEIITNWFQSKISSSIDMFVDLKHSKFKQCNDLFTGLRPDLAFIKDNTVYVLELTICHETNIISSRNYKLDKYKDLDKHKSSFLQHHNIKVYSCEVTVLGFLSLDNEVLKSLHIDTCDLTFRAELTKCAIQNSFDIYLRRNG